MTAPLGPESHLFYFQTPLGMVQARIHDNGIKSLTFIEETSDSDIPSQPDSMLTKILGLAHRLDKELCEYFSGQRKEFSLPLNPDGTPFQKKVWKTLLEIPFGKTLSYQQQAFRLGDLKSIRAMAHANARNPIAILIPCHRVIGSDGSLTGYAAGLWRKKKLLELEKSLPMQEKLFD